MYIFAMYPMKHLLILISDPLRFNYEVFVKSCLNSASQGIKKVSLVFLSLIEDANHLNSLLSQYYSSVRRTLNKLGYDYKTEIDIFFNLKTYENIVEKGDVIWYEESESVPFDHSKTTFTVSGKSRENIPTVDLKNSKRYMSEGVVAVGGTFDHLHDGHKILLSMAIFLTKRTLIVGITGAELLKNKKYAEVLEPFSLREKKLVEFLKFLLANGIRYDIYEINDVCGPTGYIKDINCLIVSRESAKGGDFVNNYRSEQGFPGLDVFIIDVVGGENSQESNNWDGKLSSTEIRKELAATCK